MHPDQLWEAVQLAERLAAAAAEGLVRPEEDRENAVLLRALQIFEAKLEHELDPDDERRTSRPRHRIRPVSPRRLGN